MPWVVRDAVDEINRAVGRRWQGLDRLLPPRADTSAALDDLVGQWRGHLAGLPGTGAGDTAAMITTLLHCAQLNPLSAPFWSRMGYRPLWTGWEVRPAASLR
jgi:hypothetical protein